MTELFLAVDGGQSATISILGSADGRLLGAGRGGPLRHHAEPHADTDANRAMAAAVGDVLGALGPDDTIVCCCLALTGSEAAAEAVVRTLAPAAHVFVLENDALAALASGRFGLGGIGLIAGTGSVAVAVGRDGGPIQVGGWGWLIGDEGGGFWIGLEALRAAARATDGVGPATALGDILAGALGATDLREIRADLLGQVLDRPRIAGLVPAVVAAADAGDAVATAITDDAAARLADLTLATLRAAPFLTPEERVVVPAGGVVRAGRILGSLQARLADAAPDLDVVVPTVPPVVGAFALALRDHGVVIDERIRAALREQARLLELDRKVAA